MRGYKKMAKNDILKDLTLKERVNLNKAVQHFNLNKVEQKKSEKSLLSDYIFEKILNIWLNAENIDEEELSKIADKMASDIKSGDEEGGY